MWHWLKVLSISGILIFTWRSSPTNWAYGWIKNTAVLNPYQAANARSALGLIDLHLIISTFLLLAPIGLSIRPSVHPSVRLMYQYNVSTLSLSSEAGTDVLLLHPLLRLLFYFVLKAAWDGASTVITNCDFTAGSKVVVAAPQSPLSHLSSLPSLPASIFIQGFKVLKLNVWQLPELQRFPYLLNLIFQIASTCCSKGRTEGKIEV